MDFILSLLLFPVYVTPLNDTSNAEIFYFFSVNRANKANKFSSTPGHLKRVHKVPPLETVLLHLIPVRALIFCFFSTLFLMLIAIYKLRLVTVWTEKKRETCSSKSFSQLLNNLHKVESSVVLLSSVSE